MYFGSEFYEENHGEWLEQFISKNGPKSLKMCRFQIEGRLARLWHSTQKLLQLYISHDELAMFSGFSRASFRYSENYARVTGVFKVALVERGLLIPVEGYEDKYEIAGNRKRIEAIIKAKKVGKESAERRWNKNKSMGTPMGKLCQTQCNDNDNDNGNDNELRNPPIPPFGDDEVVQVSQNQKSKKKRGSCTDLSVLAKIWNDNTNGLPKVAGMTDKRRASENSRLKEFPEIGDWVACATAISNWDFGRGNNARGWKATFDYFVQPATMLKFKEGTFRSKQQEADERVDSIFDQIFNKNGEMQ